MGLNSPTARLERLLGLAQAYRGWTRKQLAEALGRDPTRLVPESGNPKLDLVFDLAGVMDWPVEDVASYLRLPPTDETSSLDAGSLTFEELSQQSLEAHRSGRYRDAVALAQQALRQASSGEQKAIACVREASGWDGMGRHTKAMEAVRRGLSESGLTDNTQLMLQTNLAIAHYTLWQLIEANAIAHCLLSSFVDSPPDGRLPEIARAYAYYVRGHSHRRIMGMEDADVQKHGRLAMSSLTADISIWNQLASKYDQQSYLGVANTCRGGLLEVKAALGEVQAEQAIEEIVGALDRVTDLSGVPVGDELESYGWWCVFGCNIALRHLESPKKVQQIMAILTNKADEIAVRLDNWALRERVFSMDFERRQRFADWTGMDANWTIDKDDLRVITGTMGRFPRFRETGWQLIESSRIVSSK